MAAHHRTQEVVHNTRDSITKRTRMTELALISVCCSVGLASMFSGIWLSDLVFNEAIESDNSVLVMRLYSVVIYASLFLISWRWSKRSSSSLRRFFLVNVFTALAMYFTGVACLLFVAPQLDAHTRSIVLWIAFFLVKGVGASVSVGLVCVFSQLDTMYHLRASALGMLGAFLIYSILSQVLQAADLGNTLTLAAAAGLLMLSCALGTLGMDDSFFDEAQYNVKSAPEYHVVRRPVSQIVTPGLIIMLVFSAMMLGYLRSGYLRIDVHSDPYSIVVLVVLLIAAIAWERLLIEHVFYAAVTCAAASILLLPFLELISYNLADILCSVGTALFEVVVWALAVWATRNSESVLSTAAGTRFAAVSGHLLGTIAVVIGMLVSTSVNDAATVSGMLIMFSYMVMLVVALKNPSMKPPVMVHEEEGMFLTPMPASEEVSQGAPAHEEERLSQGAQQDEQSIEEKPQLVAEVEEAPNYEELYWDLPCQTISETYGLTPRETEVLGLLAHGYSMASMAENLYISKNTLKMHMRNIYIKLDVHSRQDVISLVDLVRNQLAEQAF